MPKIRLRIEDSAFNDIYIPLYEDDARYLVLFGGGSSGKSEFCSQKALLRTIYEPKRRIYCIRKVGKTIRGSQFRLLKDQILRYGMQYLFNIRETDMTISSKVNDNEILSLGLDDREKIKSLAEPTDFWIEEPTELEPRDLRQLDIRLRGWNPTYKQMMLSFNPISDLHFLKDKFCPPVVEQALERGHYANFNIESVIDGKKFVNKVSVCHSTYRDNKFLPDEDKAVLESYKDEDPQYYNIYCLGKWGSIGNLVYPKGFEIIERFPTEFDETIYGLDFGFQHPTALVKVGIRDGVYYIEEKFCEKRLILKEIIEKLYEEVDNKNDVIYCDSAEPDKISEIEQSGFNALPSMKGNFSVKNGIDFIKSCTIKSKEENITFNKEVKSYKWREDRDGQPIEGEVVKINDDCCDAMRYAIYSHSRKEEVHCGFI